MVSGSVGFFDSGVGGLTVWHEVVKLLPNESTIYIADSKNAPYGKKTSDEIIQLSFNLSETLIKLGCKIIVVSCNTATTQAISFLRERFDIPFIGIEPAVKPAALASKAENIGVLATHGTIESKFFNSTIQNHSGNVEVHTQVGEGLVSAIENGELHSENTIKILSNHLNQLLQFNVDHIVLGCTHYPLLTPMIETIIGTEIKVVDSGLPVAMQAKKILSEKGLLNTNTGSVAHQLYSSGNLEILRSIVKELDSKQLNNISYSSLYQSE